MFLIGAESRGPCFKKCKRGDGSRVTSTLKAASSRERLRCSKSRTSASFSKNRAACFGARTIDIKAVDDVSFELHESDIVSVVGESGSGKTTLARCIMGLAVPTSGSIKFNGVEVTKLRGQALHDYRRQVQMIFQDPFETLNPGNTVFATLSDPITHLTGETNPEVVREKIFRLLEEIGLDPSEVVDRYPHQLSGGQRQRINIARALATDPKLLIADEPITMLDAAQRKNILVPSQRLEGNEESHNSHDHARPRKREGHEPENDRDVPRQNRGNRSHGPNLGRPQPPLRGGDSRCNSQTATDQKN